MVDLLYEIGRATDLEIHDILFAVQRRYCELFPDWEITIISLEKNKDRSKQIDDLIRFMQSMKTLQ